MELEALGEFGIIVAVLVIPLSGLNKFNGGFVGDEMENKDCFVSPVIVFNFTVVS